MNESMEFKGVIHGRIIELERVPGMADGQAVVVTVQACPGDATSESRPGDGIRRSSGAWNDDEAGLDAFLDWTRRMWQENRPEYGE